MRLGTALIAAVAVLLPLAIQAEVPDQAGWDAARQTVTIRGDQVVGYVELGADPAVATGVPVVLIHGYTDNSRSWSLMAPALAAALPDRRIVALDLRGHGASSAPDCCYGPDSLAHDAAAAMDGLGIEKADLVGHSLGSITSAFLAATRPDRVNRLVLVSSTVRMPAEPTQWLWDNVPTLPNQIDPDSQFMLDWFANPNPVPAEFLDRERAEGAAVPRQVWMGVLQGLTAMDWSLLAPRISAPVAVLWGDQDALFGAESQEWLHAALPDATRITYPGAGHNMFWEQPDKVAADIAGFLGK